MSCCFVDNVFCSDLIAVLSFTDSPLLITGVDSAGSSKKHSVPVYMQYHERSCKALCKLR